MALTQSDEGMHQSGRQKFRRTSSGLDLKTKPAPSFNHPLLLDGEECPFSSKSASNHMLGYLACLQACMHVMYP